MDSGYQKYAISSFRKRSSSFRARKRKTETVALDSVNVTDEMEAALPPYYLTSRIFEYTGGFRRLLGRRKGEVIRARPHQESV